MCDSCTHVSHLWSTRCLARIIGESTISRSRRELKWEEDNDKFMPIANGNMERGYAHGITIRIQLKKLILGPLGSPRRFYAGKWARFFGMDIIVAEAVYGILSVSPLQTPSRQRTKTVRKARWERET